jgi:hypothetical protein
MNVHRSKASASSGSALQSSAVGAITMLLVAAYAGCGGAGTPSVGAGASDAGVGAKPTQGNDSGVESDAASPEDTGPGASDANGATSTTYPAFPVDVAQVTDNGGPVLAAPVIVTVTWSTDPDAPTYDALGDTIGASAYWKEINSEYGVGPATSGAANHVSITTAPPSAGFADSDLDALVEASAGSSWPADATNTLYAVYLPPGSALYFGGLPDAGGQDACQMGVGGYHTESANKNIVYAIMPHCSGFQTADVEDAASHELNEASTDPHTNTNPAYYGFDQNHLAFEFFNQFQDELGDACESFTTSTDSTDFAPYTVQRQWSNKSAAAGSQWCLPKLAEPFYNTTFLPTSNLDTINVDLTSLGMGFGPVQSKGFKVALNATRTFPIGLFSDMPTGGAFTLDIQGLGTDYPIAQDQNGNDINNGNATVTLDKTSGQNGDIANVTVTPTAYSSLGITFFYVRAVLAGSQQHHYLPVIISQN